MEAPFLLFAVGLVAVGLVAWFSYQQQAKRRAALLAFATSKGLTWTHRDPIGISNHHPFKLWNAGDERSWENVLRGTIDGKAVLLFDYEYVDISRDSDGNQQRRTYTFSCAVAELPGCFTPGLQIEPETMMSRLKDKAGFRDLELESEEFNRRFEIGTRDRKFAVAFLDARMMSWLMSTPKDLRFEVLAGHVLIASSRVDPPGLMLLHHMATDFANRTPDVVRDIYRDR